MDSAHRTDEKNGVICLVIMMLWASKLWALKCQKLLFLNFLLMTAKKSVTDLPLNFCISIPVKFAFTYQR